MAKGTPQEGESCLLTDGSMKGGGYFFFFTLWMASTKIVDPSTL